LAAQPQVLARPVSVFFFEKNVIASQWIEVVIDVDSLNIAHPP